MARRDSDDDAPWLAEATPAPRTTVSRRSLFWTLFIVLALATIAAVGLIMLMAKKAGGSTQGYMNAEQAPVITAEPGPYKIAPTDPAGMKIEGLDGTMYTAGEGIDSGSNIDPTLAPEVPLPRPGAAGPPRELIPDNVIETIPSAGTAPAAAPAQTIPRAVPPAPAIAQVVTPKPPPAKPAAPLVTLPAAPPATPAKPAATKSGTVQLGAFSSEEKAAAAWVGLSGRHGLSGKRIIAVENGGRTLYRLRASSSDPAATCATIKAAGDACAAVE